MKEENIFEVYNLVTNLCRKFFNTKKIAEILPSLNSPEFEFSSDKMFYIGSESNPDIILPASHSFHKQYACQYIGALYCIAPCYRKESINRLSNNMFYQIEVELPNTSIKETQDFAIELLSFIELGFLNFYTKDQTASFNTIDSIDLTQERNQIRSLSEYNSWSSEFSKYCKNPTWINYTPQTSQPLLNKSKDQFYSMGFDLLLPKNYGELLSGGLRDKHELKKFFNNNNKIDTEIESCGFGIGLERLINFLVQTDTIQEVSLPYNRVKKRLYHLVSYNTN